MGRAIERSWIITIVVAAIIGAAIGAVLTLAVRNLDSGGDTLRIYMGAMTALLGGGIGLASARLIDRTTDIRKVRRRIRLDLLTIAALRKEWESLAATLAKAVAAKAHELEDKDLSADGMLQLYKVPAILDRFAQIVAMPPNFDEIIDSQDDFDTATNVSAAFRYAARLSAVSPADNTIERPRVARTLVRVFAITDTHQKSIDHLRAAEAHFADRLAT